MAKITLEILIVSNCDTVEFNTSGLKLVSKNN